MRLEIENQLHNCRESLLCLDIFSNPYIFTHILCAVLGTLLDNFLLADASLSLK